MIFELSVQGCLDDKFYIFVAFFLTFLQTFLRTFFAGILVYIFARIFLVKRNFVFVFVYKCFKGTAVNLVNEHDNNAYASNFLALYNFLKP